ncbi:MAG: hypothetical protein KBG28_27190 [Kofleriaceae bacterium]|jgi:hypothetical protein|nr:hypothetical protein [Kofleriaceae bacterium]MBP9207680.1 hypothetical protein [Kofleriaceae bacterium]
MPPRDRRPPEAVAAYFVLAALIHAVAVATRFDWLAAKLPAGADAALMVTQFPLLMLSGYFEGGIDYGPSNPGFARWMQIRSKPVKVAFTFGFIYIATVMLQTWDISLGPADPTPPAEWPLQKRAMWFAVFTGGMFFPFFLLAASSLIPGLRIITTPLRALPPVVGAALALVLGLAIGLGVLSAVTSSEIGAFIERLRQVAAAHPVVFTSVGIGATVLPASIGMILSRLRR